MNHLRPLPLILVAALKLKAAGQNELSDILPVFNSWPGDLPTAFR